MERVCLWSQTLHTRSNSDLVYASRCSPELVSDQVWSSMTSSATCLEASGPSLNPPHPLKLLNQSEMLYVALSVTCGGVPSDWRQEFLLPPHPLFQEDHCKNHTRTVKHRHRLIYLVAGEDVSYLRPPLVGREATPCPLLFLLSGFIILIDLHIKKTQRIRLTVIVLHLYRLLSPPHDSALSQILSWSFKNFSFSWKLKILLIKAGAQL